MMTVAKDNLKKTNASKNEKKTQQEIKNEKKEEVNVYIMEEPFEKLL